jgi:sulfite dehydrogenase (quinone) subunit SoeC
MHPALSVVLFTAVSGSGYGLLLLLGVLLLVDPWSLDRGATLSLLLAGSTLAIFGLIASLAHLGHPERAWRALSQWRSSWLSREGVVALLGFGPVLLIALAELTEADPAWLRSAGALLALSSLATVYCTARIYTSLQPIPAWRHPLVVPGYLGFALLGGLLWLCALGAPMGVAVAPPAVLLIVLLAVAMALLKWRYWQSIDAAPLPVDLASATGVTGAHGMRPLEAPHTEANYLLREMGFVLARRHARRLRRGVLMLLALVVVLAALALSGDGVPRMLALLAALACGQIAILIERWLFFAQARHLVIVYYGATGDRQRLGSADFTSP